VKRHWLRDWPALANDYAAYHTQPGNRTCHAFGIPLITYALVAWSQVPGPFPWIAILLPVYLLWDLRLALLMFTEVALLAALALHAPPLIASVAFVIGVALQYAGHAVYEKKNPAFLKNLTHILVGPAWILAKAFGLRVRS
jgi:uncharacterized membrane protein YGL010W